MKPAAASGMRRANSFRKGGTPQNGLAAYLLAASDALPFSFVLNGVVMKERRAGITVGSDS